MTRKMLIDATHPEETRVAIVEANRLIEFDYESKVRKQIKGGIYLAKVTRVEPSLQAAFVNFGGNRHGFLPFSEIHPDYFRIPVSDREALMAEQKAELEKLDALQEEQEEQAAKSLEQGDDKVAEKDDSKASDDNSSEEDDEEVEEVVEVGGSDKPADEDDADLQKKAAKDAKKTSKAKSKKEPSKEEVSKKDEPKKEDKAEPTSKDESKDKSEEDGDNVGNVKRDDLEKSDEELDAEGLEKAQALENAEEGSNKDNNKGRNNRGRGRYRGRNGRHNNKRANMRRGKSDEIVEGDNSGKPFRFNLRHKYKIQEVVKRGQIMLIQVSKEERGNKGAAVTTYMSLPGRYCVLMPNSPRGGGVSRKIGNFKDRKRMRDILKELTIPDGMSVILRTAGVERTKAEIKRDLDYLTRLWNTIREDTLKSSAPALINEEGNLIKRSIRDLYTRDIEDVLVSGERGYKVAKDFMKMLVPSHAKKVKEYKDDHVPLFHRYNVEKQINEIGEITVILKSGGYLVINPTEALVSVDVNSGKATKERHIEDTAVKTNLEAAAEVARQLRLRDLGGLVVIDFIDMEERRNNRKVENKLRDALSSDRARIQVGRISSFGLLELSRQRLNPSLTEAQYDTCVHCAGTGTVKTLDFAAITAMRALEEEGIKGRTKELSLNVPNSVAVYILNNKRDLLATIEKRYEYRVHIRIDEKLQASEFRIDTISSHEGKVQSSAPQQQNNEKSGDEEGGEKQRKGRRRGRRGGRRRNSNRTEESGVAQDDASNASEKKAETSANTNEAKESDAKSDKAEAKKKPVKKESAKKPSSTKQVDAKAPVKAPKPSNDVQSSKKEATSDQPKDYEAVNVAPEKKKKGWWNRLTD